MYHTFSQRISASCIYFLTFFFSCGLTELSLKSMESSPSSLAEQGAVLSRC